METLKEEIKKITGKEIQINIFEVKRPDLEATLVANNIARQVEGRIFIKEAIKMATPSTMRMGYRRNKGSDFWKIKWDRDGRDLKCIKMEEHHYIHLEQY